MQAMWLKRTLTAVVLVAAATACSDAVTAPERAVPAMSVLSVNASAGAGDTSVTTFTVKPQRDGWFVIGGKHKIHIPARAICDSDKSSYGPTEWDRPCKLESKPVEITAVSWTDANGHPSVEFSPELRFAPNRAVTLYLFDPRAVHNPTTVIVSCGYDGQCVDESIADPSLATHSDDNGFLFRRIKHFSGYNISVGRL
jgi:hypothetical protein